MVNYQLNSRERLGYFMSGTPPLIYSRLLLVGLCMIYVFIDLTAFKYANSETRSTKGVITKILEYDDGTYIDVEYIFSFEIDQQTYVSSSFSDYNEGNQGDTIDVEYIKSIPQYARILGSDQDSGKIGFTILGTLMILAAFIGFSYSYKKLSKLQGILKKAGIIKSFKAESEATQISVNEESHYEITYYYEVNGETHRVFKLSPYKTQEHQVNVLYAIDDPGTSVLLSKLPSDIEKKIKATHRHAIKG